MPRGLTTYRPRVSESTRLMPKWLHLTALAHSLLSSSISFTFNPASFKPFFLAFHTLGIFLPSVFLCPLLAPPIQTQFFCFLNSSPLLFHNECSSITHNFYTQAAEHRYYSGYNQEDPYLSKISHIKQIKCFKKFTFLHSKYFTTCRKKSPYILQAEKLGERRQKC